MSYSPFSDSPEYHESIAGGKPEPPTQWDGQTQKTLSEFLDEIESRANAATPGPWKWEFEHDSPESPLPYVPECSYLGETLIMLDSPYEKCREDCAFVAAARSDVPALVKALRRAVEFAMGWRDPAADRAIEEQLAQLLREPADSVVNGNENQPAAPVNLNPSPSSAVADDVEAAREPTVAELVAWLKAKGGASYIATEQDVQEFLSERGVSSPVGGATSEEESWTTGKNDAEIWIEVGLTGRGYVFSKDALGLRGCQYLELLVNKHNGTPPSVEHVKQMERDMERLNWLEAHPQVLAHCSWVNTNRGRIFSMGCEFDPLIGDCHETLRAAINKAILSETDGSSPATSVESPEPPIERWEYLCGDGEWRPCEVLPWEKDGYITIRANGVKHLVPQKGVRPAPPVSSVERDAQKDLGLPGAIHTKQPTGQK